MEEQADPKRKQTPFTASVNLYKFTSVCGAIRYSLSVKTCNISILHKPFGDLRVLERELDVIDT
ncbi:MAG: hypothetical protein RL266_1475 [Bacteroidota bacterium]|jgi:hypothetical protein